MERILITGASGQLGLALNRLLADKDKYLLNRTDAVASQDGKVKSLDITDEQAVNKMFADWKPEIVINCAALTAVDLCESKEELAYQINALGPKNLAVAAEMIGAKLIHISTDYVFDGQAKTPYVESDETHPTSVYGKTKLEGEKFAQNNCSRTFILRTAWLYGEGKNFVKTMLRLAGYDVETGKLTPSGNKIRVVADQYGSPTSALELARAIVYLMDTDRYGIYHATCEGITNWYEFAVIIFKEAGIETEVEAISTSEYPTPARRPMYSVLDNKALRELHGYTMMEWKDAFMEYMRNGMK